MTPSRFPNIVRINGERIASYNCRQVAINHAIDIYNETGGDLEVTVNGKNIKEYIE